MKKKRITTLMTTKPTKLSPDDILKAYNMYYNYDPSRPKPTMAYLAHLFNVSTQTMFMSLNREKERRMKANTS